MRTIETFIPIGLGDLIYVKAMLDPVKHNYDQIKISLHKELIKVFHGDSAGYGNFLDQLGQLFFSEPPYDLGSERGIFRSPMELASHYQLQLQKPNLIDLLCKGSPLELEEEYIVLTTKIRYISKDHLNAISGEFWQIINLLSQKYKIVILGERMVEMNQEYLYHSAQHIYGIYDDIIRHVPADRLLDLTVPALGITSPELEKLQQDCLIMNKAKIVITLGVGGNFCMATAVANTVGYRTDTHDIFEALYNNKTYPNLVITKDWATFTNALRQYL